MVFHKKAGAKPAFSMSRHVADIPVMFQCLVLSRGNWTRHRRDIRDMKNRTPTDNSRALAHALSRRPGLKIVSSGHVLEWTSSCVTDPVCQRLPDRDEINWMIQDDIIEYYDETVASSSYYSIPR